MTLEVSGSEAGARMVKARLERTSLGQVARRIRAVLKPSLTHQVRAARAPSNPLQRLPSPGRPQALQSCRCLACVECQGSHCLLGSNCLPLCMMLYSY